MDDPIPDSLASKVLELSENFEIVLPSADLEDEETGLSETMVQQQSNFVSWESGLQLILNVITLFVALLSIQQSNSGTQQLVEESQKMKNRRRKDMKK